ncbi:MAG: tRNA threonylcarbamoyladenosine dehydratase [Spirochaetales bacterium]|uniref:tRNA threonylcarbamoyladenosine dehydratase n=1 Tax=Candidatus Thalassospirochaeta sargassi TaxID=3119039 RepID=A0AAJ1I9M2_9SPIO|nr:tRNA threonylcarbamoyladenosine dehydratase [Spirochaetales bacterium]
MERFSRTEKLIGQAKLEILQESSVTLVGAGAVGSFAAEALVRSGIGSITIVDFDVISLSNINRQLYALESTLGRPKTKVAAERLLDINPSCKVKPLNIQAVEETIPEILADEPDILIDAIDTVNPKLELLSYAVNNGIPVISSMGAARRFDPTSVKTGDLFKTAHCPLARLMRKYLRRRGIKSGIMCVYSDETPHGPKKGEIDNDLTGANHSTKILGSLPTVTGIFGLMLADAAIKFLIEKT